MKNWFSKLLADTNEEGRNIFAIALIMFGAGIISLPLYVYLAIQQGSWQLYVILGAVTFFLIASGLSAVLSRQNRKNAALVWLFGSLFLIIPIIAAMVEGVGIVLAVTVVVVTILIVRQTLSGRWATRTVLRGVVTAIVTVVIDLYVPWERASYPLISTFIPYIAVAVLLVLGVYVLRGYRQYSLSTKLIGGFLLVTLIPLGVTFFLNNRSVRQILTDNANTILSASASATAHELDAFITGSLTNVRSVAQSSVFEDYLALAPSQRAGSETETVLYNYLRSIASRDPIYISSVGLIDARGVDLADTYTPDVNSDKKDRVWFTAPFENGLPFASPLEFSAATGQYSLYFSAPIRNVDGAIIGILRVRYNAAVVQKIVRNAIESSGLQGTSADLFDENHIVLAVTDHPDEYLKTVVPLSADELAKLQAENRLPEGSAESLSFNEPDLEQALNNASQQPIFTFEEENEQLAFARLETQPWVVTSAQNRNVFLAPAQQQTQTATLLAIAIAALVAAVGYFVAQSLSAPITRLTVVAEQIAAGDINAQAKVETQDEIGVLAGTFNTMTAQLRDFIASLEQRVQERTKALSSVAEVGTAASTILETDKLLQEVVDLTKERFGLYHAHIYLMNDTGDTLVLASGAGEPGRIMVSEGRSIPLDREQSLVARAARERKGVTVNDVTEAPDFLPNPLLPDTHAELAVPMVVGERLIGVFDVQSEFVGRFTDADIAVQTTLASQVASAVQNAYQYGETKAALSQSERLFNASDRLSRAVGLQELVKAAVEGLGIPNIDRAVLGSLGYDTGNELDSMTIVANWSQSDKLQATPVGTHYSKEMLSSLSMFTSSEPLFFNDMLNDERVDETTKAIARKVDYRSVAALPLFIGSRRDALILLEGKEPHNFTQDETRLFTALGPQLATILENRRQFERTQEQAKREAMLNAITQKIQSATTIESALQMTARELGRALGMKPTLVTLESEGTNGNRKSDKEG